MKVFRGGSNLASLRSACGELQARRRPDRAATAKSSSIAAFRFVLEFSCHRLHRGDEELREML
jgi:hypothetical protein